MLLVLKRDTNFLFSILDLHSHPESNASKILVELGTQLNIKFRYLYVTLQELKNKGKDFDSLIPKNFSRSEIKALINSEKIDNFTLRYFEKKPEDMDNTPHPLDVVGHAQNNLKSKNIEIYRFPSEALSSQEEYLKDQESKFATFLSVLDDNRVEKGLKMKGLKEGPQIYHDIFLREAIIHLRSTPKVSSINDVKYFGVTLDKTLIKFDQYEIYKKKDGVNIPIFFSPSILLKKLLKYAPVKSDDYRRAFINTLSTPALDNNSFTSKIVVRSVKYFHNMGISDEKMILDCIKDEMFLNKFKELESNQELLNEFVESALQSNYKKLNDELIEKQGLLEIKTNALTDISDHLKENIEENDKLNESVKSLKETLQIYNVTINRQNKVTVKNSVTNAQLTLDDEKKNQKTEKGFKSLMNENEKLKQIIKEKEDKSKFIAWRIKGFWNFLPLFTVIFLVILIFCWQDKQWNYISILINKEDQLKGFKQDLVKFILTTLLLTLLVVFPVKNLHKRFFSEEEKRKFFQNLIS